MIAKFHRGPKHGKSMAVQSPYVKVVKQTPFLYAERDQMLPSAVTGLYKFEGKTLDDGRMIFEWQGWDK